MKLRCVSLTFFFFCVCLVRHTDIEKSVQLIESVILFWPTKIKEKERNSHTSFRPLIPWEYRRVRHVTVLYELYMFKHLFRSFSNSPFARRFLFFSPFGPFVYVFWLVVCRHDLIARSLLVSFIHLPVEYRARNLVFNLLLHHPIHSSSITYQASA